MSRFAFEGFPMGRRPPVNSGFLATFSSPRRDFVINKAGAQTKLSTLLSMRGGLVAVYFGGGWCPACKTFAARLAPRYNQLPFPVLYVSGDRSRAAFEQYFRTHPWFAIPYEEEDLRNLLFDKFGVRGIPTVLMFNSKGLVRQRDGPVDGRELIEQFLNDEKSFLDVFHSRYGSPATPPPVAPPSPSASSRESSPATTPKASTPSTPTSTRSFTADEWKQKSDSASLGSDFAEAVRCLDKAIEMDKSNHLFYVDRSAAYSRMDNHEESLKDATRAIKCQSNFPKAHYRKAYALFSLGQLKEAATACQEGLRHDPRNESLMNLAEQCKPLALPAPVMRDPPAYADLYGSGPASPLSGADAATALRDEMARLDAALEFERIRRTTGEQELEAAQQRCAELEEELQRSNTQRQQMLEAQQQEMQIMLEGKQHEIRAISERAKEAEDAVEERVRELSSRLVRAACRAYCRTHKACSALRDAVAHATSFDAFEIVTQRAGQGAMGMVAFGRVRGPDGTPFGPEVAIKAMVNIYDGGSLSLRMRELFGPEHEIPLQHPHPHVVEIYHSFNADASIEHVPEVFQQYARKRTTFIVMKRYATALEPTLCAHSSPAPDGHRAREQAILLVAVQILRAVAHLVSHGIVHRDIKPDNLFVDELGRVVLGDFGLAHKELRFAYLSSAGHTQKGGNTNHMPPEVLERLTPGEIRYDAYDAYSVGVMAYTALLGRHPYHEGAMDKWWDGDEARTRDALIPPHPLPPDTTPRVARTLTRLVAKDPAARPTPLMAQRALEWALFGSGDPPRDARAAREWRALQQGQLAAAAELALESGDKLSSFDLARAEYAFDVSVEELLSSSST